MKFEAARRVQHNVVVLPSTDQPLIFVDTVRPTLVKTSTDFDEIVVLWWVISKIPFNSFQALANTAVKSYVDIL